MKLERWSEIRKANPGGRDVPVQFYWGGGFTGDSYFLSFEGKRYPLSRNIKGAIAEAELVCMANNVKLPALKWDGTL